MAQNEGKMAVLSAEGDFFDILAGRYTGEGKGPSLGVYLKGHTGELLQVDRITRQAEEVENPALTIGIAVQPDVLHGLRDVPTLRGRGMLARVLYSLPRSTVGRREINTPPVSQDIRRDYNSRIEALLSLRPEITEDENEQPYMLTLSPEAHTMFVNFQTEIEPMLASGGDLSEMVDWAGKLAGAVSRIAGLLHLAKNADVLPISEIVSAQTLASAIHIGLYFAEHARAALAGMDSAQDLVNAEHIIQWIRREGATEFTKRDAHYKLQGRFKEAKQLDPALAVLCSHGYIKDMDAGQDQKRRGRNPSPKYRVNPRLTQKTELTKYHYDRITINSVKTVTASPDPEAVERKPRDGAMIS